MDELSSCKCDKCSLWPPPNICECLFSGTLESTVLREDLGRLVEELELLVGRCFAPRAPNLNLASIASRFLDWGGRLCAAYGSFASPPGVNGLVYVDDLLGLVSREAGTDRVPGPIEKAP